LVKSVMYAIAAKGTFDMNLKRFHANYTRWTAVIYWKRTFANNLASPLTIQNRHSFKWQILDQI